MKSVPLAFVLSFVVYNALGQLPWQMVYSGSTQTNYHIIKQADNGSVYAFSPDQGGRPVLIRSNSNGDSTTWINVSLASVPLGRVKEWPDAFFASGHDMYIVASDTIWWSEDYALTWRKRSSLPFKDGKIEFIPFVNNTIFYLGSGGLYNSIDQGLTWKQLSTSPVFGMMQRGAETFAFDNNTVLKSSDGGANWIKLNSTMPASSRHRVLLSNDRFLVFNDKAIYESSDAINWTLKPTTGLPARLDACERIVKAPKSDTLFATMVDDDSLKGEIFISPDGGISWSDFSLGIPDRPEPPYALSVANGYVFCSGPSGEIFRTNKQMALSAGITNKGLSGFKIYPNPTHGSLTIEGIQSGTLVQVFNIAGQQIMEIKSKGPSEVVDINSLLPGNYVLQLKHGDRVERHYRIEKL
ncbi:MAG: T9SS type A sorting domain-containing protein [Sphingobacteriales bacterium]|nr:MAG: T9SS type A sorting domain-containing protein [Sphingobacteriales bacterium]